MGGGPASVHRPPWHYFGLQGEFVCWRSVRRLSRKKTGPAQTGTLLSQADKNSLKNVTVQGFKGSGVQGFKGSGVQRFKGSEVQRFKVHVKSEQL